MTKIQNSKPLKESCFGHSAIEVQPYGEYASRPENLFVIWDLGFGIFLCGVRGFNNRSLATVYQKHKSLLIRKKMYRG